MVLLPLATGCRPAGTRFEIVSLRNPSQPERYLETFERAFHCARGNANWVLVCEVPGRSPEHLGDHIPPEATGADQLLKVEIFWRARPGTTFAESSQTNANILYCLITPTGTITYEGAGFVAFNESSDGGRIVGRMESAALQPARIIGDAADLFGPCRMSGEFTAVNDRKAVHARLRELDRRLSPR